MTVLRPAFLLFILLALITGGVYPLIATGLGQWWFNAQANGSLIREGGAIRGSWLVGQDFTRPEYFHSRPSATAQAPYNPLASGGSNLAASNPALDETVAARVATLRAENPQAAVQIPVELITASASGLDGQLTPAAVTWQIPRVAQARHMTEQDVARLVAKHTATPLASFIGQPVVNIVALNLALDARKDN